MKASGIVATLIASVAVIIAALIISSGMRNLGRSIERAGPHGHSNFSVPSTFHVNLQSAGDGLRGSLKDSGNGVPLHVEVKESK